MMQKNLAACRIEPGSPGCQSNAVRLFQSGSGYFTFFSRIYQKKIVIPVGRIVHLLADRLSVG